MVKKVKKGILSFNGSGITLKNNEIRDIVKIIKSLENKGILSIGSTRKITNQEGGFLDFLRSLMTAGLPWIKSVLTPLTKSVLIPLGIPTETWVADAAIQKIFCGSGSTALILSNKEMKDITKIVKLLEESRLLIKWISKIIKNEAKEQKGGFLSCC